MLNSWLNSIKAINITLGNRKCVFIQQTTTKKDKLITTTISSEYFFRKKGKMIWFISKCSDIENFQENSKNIQVIKNKHLFCNMYETLNLLLPTKLVWFCLEERNLGSLVTDENFIEYLVYAYTYIHTWMYVYLHIYVCINKIELSLCRKSAKTPDIFTGNAFWRALNKIISCFLCTNWKMLIIFSLHYVYTHVCVYAHI